MAVAIDLVAIRREQRGDFFENIPNALGCGAQHDWLHEQEAVPALRPMRDGFQRSHLEMVGPRVTELVDSEPALHEGREPVFREPRVSMRSAAMPSSAGTRWRTWQHVLDQPGFGIDVGRHRAW